LRDSAKIRPESIRFNAPSFHTKVRRLEGTKKKEFSWLNFSFNEFVNTA